MKKDLKILQCHLLLLVLNYQGNITIVLVIAEIPVFEFILKITTKYEKWVKHFLILYKAKVR